MKPNFALSLSFDGIGLLHRTHPGWHLVGEVALAHEDLSGELARLSDMARALDPKGIRSKLIIPPDQVKYLSFETDSRDPDIIEAQVRNAIDGATPYALSELAYDWTASAGEVYVAAVALETLWEAEAFAIEHRFEPLSFVAIPAVGAFEGEPFFGETRHAQTVLGADAQVERDVEAVRIVGKAKLPKSPKPAATAPTPASEPKAAAPRASAPKAEPATEAKSEQKQEPAKEPTATAKPAEKPQDAPLQDTPKAPATAPNATKSDGSKTDAGKSDTSKPDTVSKPEDAKPDAPIAAPVSFSSTRARSGSEAPKADAKPVEMPKARFGAATDTPKAPPAPKPTAPKPQPSAAKPTSAAKPASKPAPNAEPKRGPTTDTGADVAPAPGFIASAAPQPGPSGMAKPAQAAPAKPKLSATDASSMAKTLGASLFGAVSKAKSAAGAVKPKRKPDAPKAALDDGLKKPAAGSAPATVAQARTPQPKLDDAALDETQRMTVFGARSTATATRQSPRFLALILTAILLLFLVAVAAWAAIFLDDGVAGLWRNNTQEVQIAEETEPPPSVPAAPSADTGSMNAEEAQDTVAALPDPEAAPDPAAAEPQVTPPDATLVPEVLPTPIPEELSPDEARARYAATGIWQVAPDAPTSPNASQLKDPYQTTLDPEPGFADAVALPRSDDLVADARPPTPSAPPPPGRDFERDERGFILATPEGTEGPEGILIFTGRPEITPPPTPERAEPDALDAPSLAAPQEPTQRPRLRPDDLSDLFERSTNRGRTLAELQTFRPRARPLNPQQIATAEANETARAQGADFENDPFAGATEEAIAVSLKPRPRPANFAQIAAAAQAAAAAEPVSAVQRVEPVIPTQASVARAATDKNQISLRKVNLIGVYGKPGSRRALVRLANGSYRKVEVGDQLDGGQVAAIGENELRYVKRGNAVTLKMPRG